MQALKKHIYDEKNGDVYKRQPQGAAGQVARLRAQAEHVVRIVQRKGVLAGRPVPYRGVIHAITLSPSRRPRRRHNTFAAG